jgi:uncharacterized protein (TIGR02246 family)
MLTIDESEILSLYQGLLAAWNMRDAEGFAATFDDDGEAIGFDGTEMRGRARIADELGRAFRQHPTGRYVAHVRSVELIHPAVGVLRAVAAVVRPGGTEIEPLTESVVRMIAIRRSNGWRVSLLDNTPIQLHDDRQGQARIAAELRA